MKKAILLLVLPVVPCLAQNPVEEAKTKIAKQKHEAIVQHAKELLERKESLESELTEIDAKLAKLASGEDVKMPKDGNMIYTSNGSFTTGGVCTNCLSLAGTTNQ